MNIEELIIAVMAAKEGADAKGDIALSFLLTIVISKLKE